MNIKEIRRILSLGENQNVEFKSSLDEVESIGHNICAFLNTSGGYIIIGIDSKGKGNGINELIEIEKFKNDISDNLMPKSLISFEIESFENKKILIIEIPLGSDIPYSYKNNVYIRENDITLQANIDTIRDMIMRRQIEPERWERRFSDADINNDLENEEIIATIRSDKHDKILTSTRGDTPSEMLAYLGFIKYGRLTCGGDILFTKNPAKRFPQTRVKAVCYKNEKVDDDYLDIQTYEGPLVRQLENLFSFIKRNISISVKFNSNNLKREEQSSYPLQAIREGLVNAFVHRDYSDFRGSVSVQIYSNRLEIWNSGSFPNGITSKNIINGQLSILRNPDIAHNFYTRGYMEKLGRGGLLISKICEEYGLRTPIWEENTNGVKLTFFANMEDTMDVTMDVTMGVSEEMLNLINKIENSKEYTRRELKELINLNNDEYFRIAYIKPLLELDVIVMTIPDKPKSSKQKYKLSVKGTILKEKL